MTTGLSEQQLVSIRSVLSAFPEIEVGILYGSRVKGTHIARSDIDLALLGTDLERHIVNRVRLELDESDLTCSVDLIEYQTINNVQLKSHIDRLGEVIYRKEAV